MFLGEAGTTVLGFLKHPIVVLGDKPISIMSLFAVLALLWGFSWLSRRTERFIHKALLYKDIDPGIKGSIETFSKYLVLIVGIMISMSSIGLNMNSLTAFWTVLGVGLGFGLQNITQNFISGIIILLERPIKKGDIVRIGETYVDLVTKSLLEAAKDHEKVLKSPPPTVTLEDFGESSLVFHLRIWSSELWFYDILLSELRYSITKGFKENDIRIPFPQRDVHIKEVGAGQRTLRRSS